MRQKNKKKTNTQMHECTGDLSQAMGASDFTNVKDPFASVNAGAGM